MPGASITKLGVCYYPEQWPESQWRDDAERMAALGLKIVRIGEFAWSRIENQRDEFTWGWLDEAIRVLADQGLKVVLGTPTACPPKWLIDEAPDILAWDEHGRPRRFGSRRHYCFSSQTYRRECARVVTALAERYGDHPAVIAWQIDNEYGCHDTTLSYSPAAEAAFRSWLANRYRDIDRLNRAWGTVFWSQEYRSFDEVDPPAATVTEANPAHRLDYLRFSSDQIVSFNRLQADIIRRFAPQADVMHNFMGFFTDFDLHALGADLDVCGWDSYPLGFLERGWFPDDEKLAYLRQGHPDFAAFHHDLYRGCRGRLWVMEQQPGPVNWAAYNPAPLPGMVRTWTWEAFAHGAEVVAYFRWRQAPFAQEQMHAGLHLPNDERDVATEEVVQVADELKQVAITSCGPAPVALIFSAEAEWMTRIQPQGERFSALTWAYTCYTALRELGLDVDIVAPEARLSDYRMVVAPCLPHVDEALADSLTGLTAPVLFGMRSGSKTGDFQIPSSLPPGPLQSLIPICVTRVESLRPGVTEAVEYQGNQYTVERWLEWVDSDLAPIAQTSDGKGVWYCHGRAHYLAAWPEPDLLRQIMRRLCWDASLTPLELPRGVRTRTAGGLRFVFNYNAHSVALARTAAHTLTDSGTCDYVLGGPEIPAGGMAAFPISN